MRVAILTSFATVCLITGCAQKAQQAVPKTDDEKALYALGVIMTEQLGIKNFALSDKELLMVNAGVADGARDKSSLTQEELESLMPQLQELFESRMQATADRDKAAGAEYLARRATESGAVKTDSGLVYIAGKEGTGASPTAEDTVTVHYEGKLISGKVFDSSIERGEPTSFPLGQVIPCWTEGVQKMKVGGTAQLICPPDLAYGERGNPSIPGNSTLVFDVELLGINDEGATP
jgi:FKBP-type peptidyl-prolyl cis-trans isomerase FkpA